MEKLIRLKAAWDRHRNRLRALSLALILYLLYRAGFPPAYLPIVGALYALLLLFKGGFHAKTHEFLNKRLPAFGRLHPLAKKLLVMAIFLLAYILVKQAVFGLLKMAGIDLQEKILESVNASLKGEA